MKNYKQKVVEPPNKQQSFQPALITKYMVPASRLIGFHPDTPIMEVVDALLKHDITGAPVLNERGELVGLIDDKDCLKVLFDIAYHNQPTSNPTVSNYMTNTMKTISEEATVMDVADAFLTTKYKRLLVVDKEGKLKGQISRRDILQAIHDYNERG